jgi:ureidoacrylate peracid hydrolase
MTVRIHGKDIPETLEEIVRKEVTALLIIDMQNDFCSSGGTSEVSGGDLIMFREVIPRIAEIAGAARCEQMPVIHARMVSLPYGSSDSVAWLRLKLRVNKNYQQANSSVHDFTIADTWEPRSLVSSNLSLETS